MAPTPCGVRDTKSGGQARCVHPLGGQPGLPPRRLGNGVMAVRATKTQPKPPPNLSPPARKWWRTIADEFGITDAAGILILNTAAEAFDRMKEAQGTLARVGLTTTDRHGQLRAHPCTGIER